MVPKFAKHGTLGEELARRGLSYTDLRTAEETPGENPTYGMYDSEDGNGWGRWEMDGDDGPKNGCTHAILVLWVVLQPFIHLADPSARPLTVRAFLNAADTLAYG